jgi:hypothetical protein
MHPLTIQQQQQLEVAFIERTKLTLNNLAVWLSNGPQSLKNTDTHVWVAPVRTHDY